MNRALQSAGGRRLSWILHATDTTVESFETLRRADRVAEGARLLSECGATHRGFESLALRCYKYDERQ